MAPGGFCQDCFKGTVHGDVTPSGTVETIHGLPTYVARPGLDPASGQPRTPLGIVVIISDVFGWEMPNNRALADSYARRGPFLVYLPDFMNGSAPPPSTLPLMEGVMGPSPDWHTTLILKPYWALTLATYFVPFLIRMRPSVTRPRVRAFFAALRGGGNGAGGEASSSAPLKVGAAGFCWGGKYCIELCGDGDGDGEGEGQQQRLIDCGFAAHPSSVRVPEDVRRVRAPLSVANGDDDMTMGRAAMAAVKEILEGPEQQGRHQVVIYPGARHGFAVRADLTDPREAELRLRAEDQAVDWFQRHFSSSLSP